MDPAPLAELFRRTLDPTTRAEAESKLQEMHKIIGFAPSILQIVMNNDSSNVDLATRQAAVIYLKNLINTSWNEDKEPSTALDSATAIAKREAKWSVHEQDRAVIRENLVRACVDSSRESALQLQISVCILVVSRNDFPGRWPQLVDAVSVYLQTPDPRLWPGALLALYQLVKNYEYKKKEDRAPIYDAFNLLFPQIYQIAVKMCETPTSQEAAEVRKLVLKIFYAMTQFVLPLEIISKDFFIQWMELLNTVLLSAIPDEVDTIESEERSAVIWWKEKKWVMHILTRIFERYGSPGNVLAEYKDFSEWFIKTFSNGIIGTILKVIESYRRGIYVSPRVMQQCLNYLNTGVSHSLTWKLMRPAIADVIKEIIFPLMSHTKEDAELWETDPYEYVRVKFDVFEDFVSPVTAAQTLLHSICKKRKDALDHTMNMLLSVLKAENTAPAEKDGALHMIGTMADILLKKKVYKEKMEEFLKHIVFPEFNSKHGHLRARSCWMLHYFADVKYRNDNVLGEAFRCTITSLLDDKEVPVKVEAAIALQMMLTSQGEKAKGFVEPHIGKITMELLQVIRDTENDDLTTVMQKIICTYTDQLVPLACNICSHLVDTFNQVVENGDTGDDRAITAMGLLNTMETILNVMESKESVQMALEPIVLQSVHKIFTDSIMEFYEEALSLCCDLTINRVSPNMWQLLEVIYSVFNRDGVDYFIEMMPVLHNYVTVDTATFLANPDYIIALFNMCKNMLENEPGEDPECHAAKLLEVIILQCGKNSQVINQYIPMFMQLVLTRLSKEIKTSELRTMCLQVAIAALYYDTSLFFASLQSCQLPNGMTGVPVIKHFIEQWLHDTDCFIGIHDRKLSILGLCKILEAGPQVPGVSDNAARFIPSLLLLFDGLKRAYEQQQESDEDSDEESDDESDVDEEELASDEDEIDESSQMYLETLADKVNKSGNQFELSAHIEDGDLSDDDDLFGETSLEGFTTPLDEDGSVDEYDAFKNVFDGIQTKSPEWYSTLVSGLSEKDGKLMNEVFTLCAQRKASKESKSIEKQGGYNFSSQQTVPLQFAFSPNGSGSNSDYKFGK